MNDKKYLKNIKTGLGFVVKYFRFFRLLIIIIYLFFLAILVVDVFTAVEYVPSVDEVKGRFSPITAKNDIIGSIEKYFLDRENNLTENLQKEAAKDPFAPQKIENLIPAESANPADSAVVPEVNVIN